MQSKIILPNPLAKLSRTIGQWRNYASPNGKARQEKSDETAKAPSSEEQIVFPNYLQMKQLVPQLGWHLMRILTVGITWGLCLTLFIRPAVGLELLWKGIVPLLPLLFFVAPGFWRNACPLAATNQTPRLFGFTRNLTPPKWFTDYNYVIAITLFLIIVTHRKVIFNTDGTALGILILLILTTAFVMGILFKGKSGWCSSICPLLPVQRVYGQTPFVTLPNSHCQPCVGCTKNCYDFNPHTAYLADMYDKDHYFSNYRKLFVGLFPGFILAFYTLPDPPAIPLWQLYAGFLLYSLVSVGSFFLSDSLIKISTNKIAVLYGATALNLYYWFNAPTIASWLPTVVEPAAMWGLRVTILALTIAWIYRTFKKEKVYIELTLTAAPESVSQTAKFTSKTDQPKPTVVFQPENKQVTIKAGQTILETAEQHDLPIEAGCRMGVCGADPVCVIKGLKNLSPVGSDEKNTLERLGLGENVRLACVSRVKGDVTVSLKPEAPKQFTSSIIEEFDYDATIKRVVIIGNGIAGVTAADHVRRRHPKCQIDLIGREPHHLYNRMAITRLIYGRSAMQGLYLMPEKWYTDLGITTWLNTQVTNVDPESQQVYLGTGETLTYDRLILTTGGQSFVPPIAGYGMPGTFVLRTAEDAMDIRAFVQEHACQQAVIAGGGLLGLEAGYALHKVGLSVTILERSATLLKRQLDEAAAALLQAYLESLGLTILTEAETEAVEGNGRLAQVILKDGRTVPGEVFLACAGVRSEATLAKEIGLQINQGIVVNDRMQTSISTIFAAGDAAEHNGKAYGLWPVAVSQGEVAAVNAVGGDQRYEEIVPVTMLKVVGIDVTSIGRIEAETDAETEIALSDPASHRYRKVVIAAGKIVGAILIGYPEEARLVSEAVKSHRDITPHLAALRAGEWQVLAE